MKLIIVESPNKIKKIKGYAGPDYEVAASVGHIRDLVVDKETGSIGVDREHGHALIYGISPDKKDVVANLRAKTKAVGPGNVYLATDPDREGEAISWHLCQVLGLDPRTTKRVTFQEITEKAIKAALAAPRLIDIPLVHAQEGRRAVDRLVGFTVSPVLSRKIAQGLSAGRVQSVAVRLIVEREREIQQFADRFTVPVVATVQTAHGEQFKARRTAEPFTTLAEGQAYLQQVGRSSFGVVSVEKKPVERQPQPAFSTSTLQQEGVKKLKFKVQKVSDLAQKLFEEGHITYIRTDSVNLGEEATQQAEVQITAQFGAGQFQARQTKNKDGAQEAHEAIRPTHWENSTAGDTPDEQALYRLIYTRAVASQMVSAQYDQTTITLAPGADAADTYTSSTRVLTQIGYLAAYQEGEDEGEEGADEDETTLKNPVEEGEALTLVKLEARQSYARPAKRYNEATIVADLEKRGIGRPSTYASILKTIFARQYIDTGSVAGKKLTSQVLTWQNGQLTTSTKNETLGADKDKLLPTATGTQVTEFLELNFPKIMDYKFTAGCEAIFDKIAAGTQTYQQFVPMFDKNLLDWVAKANEITPDRAELQKRLVGQFEGTEMLIGSGKNGPYILHAEKYYNIPEGTNHATLSEAQAQALITQRRQTAPREVGQHQGKPVVVGQGPKGVYIKWNEKYFNAPEGTAAAEITSVQAVGFITKAQEQAAKDVLATVGKYTIGKNEWGLYVSDGEVKAKFKPGVTEDEAKATDAATCAEMIKSYKAWKKKNAGKK
ncbi:type I DNA topoisomerase [Hymenobacter sp. UV11]|uniref:type I DNA topoisomerase n=1 Tax=Hymenobacter sp. UV11 TaxID=1849735 RepID=UPI00105B4DF9|nr:type I DNA topoisomerase [Hymenobacter sp. UV11]TDN39835.1 DNA topoisomerase I [Hymenobacter sp. UV11]TFZ63243.1 type I DNA topoisomerase [Hymenobacter sp. UV11]